MYVCLCNGFTDRQVRVVGGAAGGSVASVYRALGAQPRCGKCIPMVREILQECRGDGEGGSATDGLAPA